MIVRRRTLRLLLLGTLLLTVTGITAPVEAQLYYSQANRNRYSNSRNYTRSNYQNYQPVRVGGGWHRSTISESTGRRMNMQRGSVPQSRQLGYSDSRRASQYSYSRRWYR